MTLKEFTALSEKFVDTNIPFGSLICTTHRKQLSETSNNETSERNNPEQSNADPKQCTDADPDYNPVNFEITPDSSRTLNDISEIVSVTPVRFQVTKPVSDLKTSTL